MSTSWNITQSNWSIFIASMNPAFITAPLLNRPSSSWIHRSPNYFRFVFPITIIELLENSNERQPTTYFVVQNGPGTSGQSSRQYSGSSRLVFKIWYSNQKLNMILIVLFYLSSPTCRVSHKSNRANPLIESNSCHRLRCLFYQNEKKIFLCKL